MPARSHVDDAVDPSWDDLRHLESLERLGSASAASRELGVAPSTIYRRVASLEQTLGVVCYSPREGVTGVGRELAELARRTRTSLSRIRRHALDAHDAIEGRLTLTTIDGFVPVLVDALATIARTYPKLELVLDVSDTGLSVRRGEADITLTAVEHPPRQLVGRKLFTADFGVYGTEDLAAEHEHAPWVVLGPPLHNSSVARWERAMTRERRVAVATSSRLTLNRLIAAGVGIGAIPRVMATSLPGLVEIDAYRHRARDVTLPAWLLTHEDLRGQAAVKAVMQTLVEAMQHL